MRDLLEGDLSAKRDKLAQTPLVRIVAYSLQGNHFHLLLEQLEDSGIQRFMQKLGMAYAKYFNDKNSRTGVLFEGRYKYILAQNKHQIMRLICYINRNEVIHGKQPKDEYSSRHWYTNSDSMIGLEKYQNMFSDYEKQEQDVIDQIKRERNIDKEHDKENLLE
jgi:REP element-mobilizing transposase RayT